MDKYGKDPIIGKMLRKEEFEDLREMITPKDVDHQNEKIINDIITNLQTNNELSNRLITAGINSLERLYNIAVITKTDSTGRIQIIEWFKERRTVDRSKKKSFKDVIIL